MEKHLLYEKIRNLSKSNFEDMFGHLNTDIPHLFFEEMF